MRNAPRLAVLAALLVSVACGGGGDGNGPSDPVPASLAINNGNNQTAVVGTAVALAPSVVVKDQRGNPIEGVIVTFAVQSGGGAVSGAQLLTDVDGVAQVGAWVLGTATGANTLRASVTGLNPVTFTATATPGAPASLVFATAPPLSAVNREPFTAQPVLQLKDVFGNNATQAGVQVTAVIETGGGTLGGTTTVATSAAGSASFTNLSLSGTYGPRTLRFTATGLPALLSGTIELFPGVPASLTAVSPTTLNGVVGSVIATNLNVQVEDQDGNQVQGVTVSFAVTAGGGNLATTSAMTDPDGQAYVSGWTLGTVAGQLNTVTATLGSLTPVVFSVTPVADVASKLVVTTQPGTATAENGALIAPQPAVQVADQYGNPVGMVVTVTAAVASGGSALNGTPAGSTAPDGSFSFSDLSLTGTAGPHTLGFSAPGLAAATSAVFTLTAGPATQVALSAGDGQSATVNTAVRTPPAVLVTDQSGNPVSGYAVTFAVQGGGGSLTGANALTGASGIAAVGSWTLGTIVGPNTLSATAAGLTGSPVTFTATGTPGAATQLTLEPPLPSSTSTNGIPLAQQPSVQLRDAFSNLVSQAGVTVTASIASGGGNVSGETTAQTDAGGLATFVGLIVNGPVGVEQTVQFSATGLTPVTSGGITPSAGAASLLAISAGQGQSATVGTAVATAPAVLVTDQGGNPVSGIAVTFTVTAGGGSVVGGNAVTDGSGIAAVTSWTLGTTSGTNTLQAASTGLTGSPLSFTATGTADAPVSITAQSATTQAGRVGAAAGEVPSVLVKDQHENPVPGASVAFQVIEGGGSVTTANTATDASGIATAGGWSFGRTVVGNTVTATVAALAPVNFTATVTFEVASAAAGGQHACATTVDNVPYCWGANTAGSVGDGTGTMRLGPVPVSGTPFYALMSAGADFSCGLTGTGTAFCWGFNVRGELGSGNTSNSSVPVPVLGGHSFTSLATNRVGGTNHACAITAAGSLYCWGDNTNGQLGTGGRSGTPVTSPTLADGGASYTQVTAGPLFTCGVRTGGQAYCWGDNAFGQLGNNSKADSVLTPTAVSGGLSFSKLAASQVHACGITTGGAVYCWGSNAFGRLGRDTTGFAESLVPVQVSGLSNIVDLAAGENHTCARDAAGAVYCWGDNESGQLGNGSSGVGVYAGSPVTVGLPGGVSGLTSITAGGSFTCGTASGGALYCWGKGAFGRLGTGTGDDEPLPTAVVDP